MDEHFLTPDFPVFVRSRYWEELVLRWIKIGLAKTLSIAISLDTPVYDALFIAQASSDHAPLVTADCQVALCAKKYEVTALLV